MLGGLIKILHIGSLGLWAGAMVFFSFGVALPVLAGMKEFATRPDNWLRLTTEKEGTRLAGEFLDRCFAYYFPFQVSCGVVALIAACAWWASPGWLAKTRVVLLATALLLAVLNLTLLAPRVHSLRQARYSPDAATATRAEQEFGPAHNLSLGADLVVMALVSLSLALAAWLPADN